MGTRNIISVRKGGKLRVAQYCQWDGYPEGTGVDVLEFLKGININQFSNKIDLCKLVSPEDAEKYQKDLMAEMEKDFERVTPAMFDRNYYEEYPLDNRDLGVKSLYMIMQFRKETKVVDSSEYLKPGSICEWAYEIDLDNMELKVFRFATDLVKTYDITNLPDEKTFVSEIYAAVDESYISRLNTRLTNICEKLDN